MNLTYSVYVADRATMTLFRYVVKDGDREVGSGYAFTERAARIEAENRIKASKA